MDTELIVAVVLAVVLVTGGGIAVAVRLTRRAARATKRIGSQVMDAAALPLDGRALPPLVLEPVQAITSWVDMIRPQLVPSLAPDGTITLLFSDVEGSTELNVELGDDRYVALLAEHDRLARRLVRLHHGRLVKSQGDGLMLAFKRPKDAVRYAIAFQSELPDVVPRGVEVAVRIGIHTGEVASQRGDFYGANVAFAARVAQQAKGGQVLVSAAVRDKVAGEVDARFRRGRRHHLKGIPGRHRLHALEWA